MTGRWLRGALLGGALFGSVACTLAVDLDELQNRRCPAEQKLCNDACVSSRSAQHGCGTAECSPCNLKNATAAQCGDDGACQIAACARGTLDCDGSASNGCETDVDHDPNACGSCAAAPCVVANGNPGCEVGRCIVLSCKAGFLDCNKSVADGCELQAAACP